MKSKFSLFLTILVLVWLAALAFYCLNRVSPVKEDTAVAEQLKASIEAYKTEYRRLPGTNEHSRVDVDLETDQPFMSLLLVNGQKSDPKASPGGTVFFSTKLAVQDPKTGYWQNGVLTNPGGTGGLFDSKGNYFRLRVDSDGDGKVYSPIDNEPINASVIVWSAGKDGRFESWRDNSKTW